MGKVNYGLSNVYIAKRTVTGEGVVSYDTPKALAGAKSLNFDPQGDIKKFYYDNIAYFTSSSRAGSEGELEVASLPNWFKIDYLGYKEDTNKQLVATGSQGASFALLFQVETDTQARKVIFYNCSCGTPKIEHATTEEDIELTNDVIPLVANGEVANGEFISHSTADETATNYATFFTTVAIPSFTPAP